ncbi:hypothetical protein Javan174_0016 [Streptococcus phage Javan174]|nr:hypothetical protein Javan174_0016 [Streptococcus phage Javan174]
MKRWEVSNDIQKSDLLNYRQLWWLDKFLVGHKTVDGVFVKDDDLEEVENA